MIPLIGMEERGGRQNQWQSRNMCIFPGLVTVPRACSRVSISPYAAQSQTRAQFARCSITEGEKKSKSWPYIASFQLYSMAVKRRPPILDTSARSKTSTSAAYGSCWGYAGGTEFLMLTCQLRSLYGATGCAGLAMFAECRRIGSLNKCCSVSWAREKEAGHTNRGHKQYLSLNTHLK